MQVKLDKYARDFAIWRDWAAINHSAAKVLFATEDPFLLFPAATLGHHALEMFLKSALIANGLTVVDPKVFRRLEHTNLRKNDCAWGHGLVKLAGMLAERRPEFNLSKEMKFAGYAVLKEPMTVQEGLNIFDPFFSELRYPQELKAVEEPGGDHKVLLDLLVGELRNARFRWNQSR